MHIVRRYRIPALLCALAVLLCDLISQPFANMGIIDDAAYIPMARTVAATGHIAYNGWPAAMLGWQLYLGAASIKLLGFSFTTIRMTTVLVAMALAFVLQRTLVRVNINQRNATIGTLGFVLSPLYLLLSATYMSDIFGLFAILLCLYGCLRALQSPNDPAAIAWLCFAIITNSLFGTSRQIAWLGILVMLPSTLWLLRARRRVLLTGVIATLVGAGFVLACLHWLKYQPYIIPERLALTSISPLHFFGELTYFSLDAPFLLLSPLALFLPDVRRLGLRILLPLSALSLAYLSLAVYPSHLRGFFLLEPIGECVNASAMFAYPILQGTPPEFLPRTLQALFTILAFAGLLGFFARLCTSSANLTAAPSSSALLWQQLCILLLPFSLAYIFLISERGPFLDYHDRYLLGLLPIAILCLVRYYQEGAPPNLPLASIFFIAVMAIYSTVTHHSMFAFYRARVALASELSAARVPLTSVDSGWEYNLGVELQHADHINNPGIESPSSSYLPIPTLPGVCTMNLADYTPHIHPLYAISFAPNACYGLAPFAFVHYSRWPHKAPGTLYVVRSVPPAQP
jgi:hypothetical protein